MLINNNFLISFLLTLIINILNFETHQCSTNPIFFNYNCDLGICNFKCVNGSLHWGSYHIHHWTMGLALLIFLEFFLNNASAVKNILQGAALSLLIDGLLFSDRFKFSTI